MDQKPKLSEKANVGTNQPYNVLLKKLEATGQTYRIEKLCNKRSDRSFKDNKRMAEMVSKGRKYRTKIGNAKYHYARTLEGAICSALANQLASHRNNNAKN